MKASPLHPPWKQWYGLLLPEPVHLVIGPHLVTNGKPNKCTYKAFCLADLLQRVEERMCISSVTSHVPLLRARV